ncbi:NAD-dependent epimerase/dehydratase family protein [Bacillus sp. Marseille-P3661]|uniref:NAD-dependent epimerase/dehydratase family protein n=1 Tax=Bacillus sp. Marseille-P3661 TaxID=1936234 RepID=UPI000C84FD2F|nr:NAD(P)-dependent oxidoreductase [Bacillus sp. Marseille-P3661]
MKKVIVTGASGFIGRHVLEQLLKRGYEVHAISSNPDRVTINNECNWHLINLFDYEKVDDLFNRIKANYLLHLAWELTPGTYKSSLKNFLWVQSSIRMLHAFHNNGGMRLVMAGTCMEKYLSMGLEVTEAEIKVNTGVNVYGNCKNILKQYMILFTNETNISSAWGRIYNTFGPYENKERLFPTIINSILQNSEAKCSNGNFYRDYLYVKDVASALTELLDSNIQGTVDIGTGKSKLLNEIIMNVGVRMGHPELIKLGAIKINNYEPKTLVANVRRLHQELNWHPNYSFEQGLDETIAWWKNQQNNR